MCKACGREKENEKYMSKDKKVLLNSEIIIDKYSVNSYHFIYNKSRITLLLKSTFQKEGMTWRK